MLGTCEKMLPGARIKIFRFSRALRLAPRNHYTEYQDSRFFKMDKFFKISLKFRAPGQMDLCDNKGLSLLNKALNL